MENVKKETSCNIGGINSLLFSVVFIFLLILSSVMGYVIGLSNIDDTQSIKVDVEMRPDSVLMEVIQGQMKIEMEMLKIIKEKTNQKVPIVYNIIRQKPENRVSKVVNSFNHNIVKTDSVLK